MVEKSMPIHPLAVEILDQLVERADANQRTHGHWWDNEAFVYTPPTEMETKAKLASVERRLKRAEADWEAALTPDELEWHRALKTDPKSMDDVHRRKQIMEKLYAVLDQDDAKLDLYRKYKKLAAQQHDLANDISHTVFEDDEKADDALARKAIKSFQLVMDWPMKVEDSQTASAVTTLIHAALERAGYSFEQYGFTTPIAYYDKGKLVLEIDDNEERFRYNPTPLEVVDWKKVRTAMQEIKAELESTEGWKRVPTQQGEMWEKTAPAEDLQVRLLENLITTDMDGASHWDTWRPILPGKGKKTAEAVDVTMCDPRGHELDLGDLGRMLREMRDASPPAFDDDDAPATSGASLPGMHKKAVVRADVAKATLQDYLGINGLGLAEPEAGMGGHAATR